MAKRTRKDAGRENGSAPAYEALMEKLEASVARLESGGLTLDEAIAAYEEGTALAAKCQGLLETAEQRIRELREAAEPEG